MRVYTEGRFSSAARAGIARIKWQKVNEIDNRDAYEEFLKEYPNTEFTSAAMKRIENLDREDESYWERALQVNTLSAYENFIRENPNSSYLASATGFIEKMGNNTKIDSIRESVKLGKEATGDIIIPIVALKHSLHESYIVYKQESGKYIKVTDKGNEQYKNGLDVPLLKYMQPKEGIVLYLSIEDIVEDDIRQNILQLYSNFAKNIGIDPKKVRFRMFGKKPLSEYKTSSKKSITDNYDMQAYLLDNIVTQTFLDSLVRSIDLVESATKVNILKTIRILKQNKANNKLIKLLRDENELVRVSALETILIIKPKGALDSLSIVGIAGVKTLLMAFQDEDNHVKAAAFRGLLDIGQDAIMPLTKLQTSNNTHINSFASLVLGMLGEQINLEPLLTFLSEVNAEAFTLSTIRIDKNDLIRFDKDGVNKPLIWNKGRDLEWEQMKQKEYQIELKCKEFRDIFRQIVVERKRPEIVAELVKQLQNPIAIKRWDASWMLKVTNWKPSSKEQLINYLIAAQKWNELESDTMAIAQVIRHLTDSEDDSFPISSAISTLGRIGDVQAVEPLSRMLSHYDLRIRRKIIEALQAIDIDSSISVLTRALTDWSNSKSVSEYLEKKKWKPSTLKESIYFHVAKRDKNYLLQNWSSTKDILSKDFTSSSPLKFDNALRAFVGVGKDEMIPVLITQLDKRGNEFQATLYLNSGEARLRKAAEIWAKKHGFEITELRFYSGAAWGELR